MSRKVFKAQDECLGFPITLKSGWCVGSSTAETPDKFKSDRNILIPNLVGTRLSEMSLRNVFPDITLGSCCISVAIS